MRRVLCLAAISLGLLAAPLFSAGASGASSGLTTDGFIYHFFSQDPVGHGQVVGYDTSLDGVIDMQQEFARVDRNQHVWQANRFLRAVNANEGDDIFISPDEMRQYLSSFDTNGDARIDKGNGEFKRLDRAIWHAHPPKTPRYTSFERRFFG